MIHRLSILLVSLTLLAACVGQPAAVQPTAAPTTATSAAVQPLAAPTTAPPEETSAPTAAVAATVAPPEVTSVPTTASPAATFNETSLTLDGFPPLSPPIPLFKVITETADTITIQHLRGETTIPRNPKRIVTSYGTAEMLISLGIMPIGQVSCCDISPVVQEAAPDMVFLPNTDSGPNLEQLAALKPDLIIGYGALGGDNPQNYALINAIAPSVVFFTEDDTYWQDSTRQIAALFDRKDKAEAVIADYAQRVAEIRARVARIMGNETVTPILFFDTPWLYAPQSSNGERVLRSNYVSWLYQELQLTPGPELKRLFGAGAPAFGENWLELSEELLPGMQAEHLVVFPGGYNGAKGVSESYTAYIAKPIWQAIPAVKAGNVHAIVGINRMEGYYSLLDTMERLADAVTKKAK